MGKRSRQTKRQLARLADHGDVLPPPRHIWVRVNDRDWEAFRGLCTRREAPAAVVLGLLIERYVRTGGRV